MSNETLASKDSETERKTTPFFLSWKVSKEKCSKVLVLFAQADKRIHTNNGKINFLDTIN